MTLSVHQDHDTYADNPEWREVQRVTYSSEGRESFERIEYADVETTCLKPMRGWKVTEKHYEDTTGRCWTHDITHHGFCLMDEGHKGRHSTVVFYCDGCGRTFRGEPTSSDNDAGVAFCFLCTHTHRY